MTDEHLMALERALAELPSRRALIRLLAGTTFAGWLGLRERPAMAKGKKGKPKKGGKKKKKKPSPTPPPPVFSFKADPMTGVNEVGGGDANGTGSAHFTIQGNTICGTFHFGGGTPPNNVQGTHIHKGPAGVNGDIVVLFNGPIGQQTCVSCPSTQCQNGATPSEILADPSGFYANTHTGAFPNGAIREQLVKG